MQPIRKMQWYGAAAIAAALGAGPAPAITFTPLGDLIGGDVNSAAYAISNDGTTVVGTSSALLDFEAFRWTQLTGMLSLGDLPTGGFESAANAVSSNGSVIAGYGTTGTATEAASWTSPLYLPTGIGTLGGANPVATANGVSADGTVIVGRTTTPAGTEAFRWTSGGGMVSLGDFPTGGTESTATAISDDGSVIVGGGLHFGPVGEAFRWTSGPGLVGLGDLAGGTADSLALGVSGDGNTVVGESIRANGIEAFVWTIGSGMQGLGDLDGRRVREPRPRRLRRRQPDRRPRHGGRRGARGDLEQREPLRSEPDRRRGAACGLAARGGVRHLVERARDRRPRQQPRRQQRGVPAPARHARRSPSPPPARCSRSAWSRSAPRRRR